MAGVTARLHLALMADAKADANFLTSPMDASMVFKRWQWHKQSPNGGHFGASSSEQLYLNTFCWRKLTHKCMAYWIIVYRFRIYDIYSFILFPSLIWLCPASLWVDMCGFCWLALLFEMVGFYMGFYFYVYIFIYIHNSLRFDVFRPCPSL